MTEDQVKAVFLLANIDVMGLQQITNEYWPSHSDFDDIRRDSPWWLVTTHWGLIKIGRRKGVINIDWENTGLKIDSNAHPITEFYKTPITVDDVTRWEGSIHAHGFPKAIEYLSTLKIRLRQYEYATSEEGKMDLERRRKQALQEKP